MKKLTFSDLGAFANQHLHLNAEEQLTVIGEMEEVVVMVQQLMIQDKLCVFREAHFMRI
ncbi:hypothetical protein ACLOAU_11380 [Niabella sp. CJ426]|uniref:hypothetical protein n=1 Tax=Niabella sp. CJ426 TaxID=3393740 RepID=UPI003D00644A